MKIKNDFVTNSSSCSYVICTSKDFDLKGYIISQLGPEDVENNDLLNEIDELISNNSLYEEDSNEFNLIYKLIKKFDISGFNVDSDCGEIRIIHLEDIIKTVKDEESK